MSARKILQNEEGLMVRAGFCEFFESCLSTNCQMDKYLILEATNGSTERLKAKAPVHIATVGDKFTEPCEVAIKLSSTPEDSDASNIIEITIEITKTT